MTKGRTSLGPAQALFSSSRGDNTETNLGEKTGHQIADRRIVINHENRIELRLMLGACGGNAAGPVGLRRFSRFQCHLRRQVYRERRPLAGLLST